ncbi:glycolate oxidase subunit GlcE [Hydrogenophilus islandicus]
MAATNNVIPRWQEAIRVAREKGHRVAIVGGGSKAVLPWCKIPDDAVVIATREWRGIERYEPTELVVTVRAGTPLDELEAALAERRQWLPFEPPRLGQGGTVGGAVATGLSGPARWGHGAVRDAVLGVQLLDGRGRQLRFGGEVMKNVAGYDVSRLLVGSWGTLGVILTVSLKVAPQPPASLTLSFAMGAEEAANALNRWAGKPLPLSAAFWAEGFLWLRLRGAEAAVRAAREQLGGEVVEERDAERWWQGVRDQEGPLWVVPEGRVLWRVAVPPTAPMAALGERFWFEGGGGIRWVVADAQWDGFAAAAKLGGWAWRWRGAAAGPWMSRRSDPVAAIEARIRTIFDPDRLFGDGPFAGA